MKKELTDSAALLRLAYSGIKKLNLPVEDVFLKAGVTLSQLDNHQRTPLSAQDAFWTAMEDVSQDALIGLHLGESMPLYRGHVIEYLFTSSRTFGAGLERALAYQRLVSDALHAKLVVEDDGQCYLANIDADDGQGVLMSRHFTECVLMGMVRFFKFITEGNFSALHIDFVHDGISDVDEYFRAYGCDVSMGEKESRIYFTKEILNYEMWQSEPELLRLHEQLAIEKLQKLARFDLINDVKQVIGENLETGEVSLDMVANHLEISARRLRSQLTEADTSFHQILSSYRCRLAKRLLAKTDESVERIVYLTGFSEPSTFYRAFKRWTNETPIQYRKRKAKNAQV